MPDLDALFWPRSIALVGASADKSGIRGRIVDAVRQHGFDGPLYPVSRSCDRIDDLTAYPSVSALPEPVDLAVITIPAVYVPDALAACGERGVRAAIIISSGFAEERGGDGAEREHAIRAAVERYDMAVLGPNGEGFMNAVTPLTASFSPTVFDIEGGLTPADSRAGGIAVVSQSGGVGFSFFNRGRPKELRFSFVVSMGNEAGLEGLDVVDYLLDDDNTDALLMFVESFRTPAKFARVASRAAELRKPLLIAKVGSSEAGARAVASHTASLAGSRRAYEAMFQRHGVVTGRDVDQMIDMAAGFAYFRHRLPRGKRVAILTPSGGAGIWLADVCEAHGLEVPELDEHTRAAIDRLLPAYGCSRNPVDVTAQVIFQLGYAPVLELIASSPAIDAVLVAGSLSLAKYLRPQLEELTRLGKAIDIPVIFCAYTLAHPEAVALLARAGFPCLTSMPNAAHTISAMAEYRSFLERAAGQTNDRVEPLAIPADVATRLAQAGGVLCEHEAKAVLSDLGIAANRDTLVTSEEQAVTAAADLRKAVALKVQSADISHKSQAGALALNLESEAEVRSAYRTILDNARSKHPGADIHGVLVSPMTESGVEIIIGTNRDADFGPILVLGAGGTLVEVLDDVIATPAPASRSQLLALLDDWKGKRLLDGSAGLAVADIDALIDLAVMVSRFAACADSVSALDLNPVVVHPRGMGVSVVDALIITHDEQAADRHSLVADRQTGTIIS
ncbi:MAG: acetate--CoA ligase family protein [Gammaproteobacteria bacterium]|nr:MAG: acetate--CoA ligase family protein [Gammaproteobacteria bacterium]